MTNVYATSMRKNTHKLQWLQHVIPLEYQSVDDYWLNAKDVWEPESLLIIKQNKPSNVHGLTCYQL